ncbi:MAG: cytochrome c [Flavobacterium sp.]|uniref:cytochrome c n=1 Tax=Flavobacterium sp. TaxID=239 RepID=UPI0025BED87A|nr:cytochrome c [Flavobacterium sp.]MCK6608186.1 cytochrome c [Flavobacterium sp.]
MKKFLCICIIVFFISACETTTYEDIQGSQAITGPITYNSHVKNIVSTYCSSCHSTGGTASFRPFTTYEEVKDAIQNTNLLDRIQRQNGEPGQMPQTGRMPQDKINTIIQWNSEGLAE